MAARILLALSPLVQRNEATTALASQNAAMSWVDSAGIRCAERVEGTLFAAAKWKMKH
jgi:hypothetical protein